MRTENQQLHLPRTAPLATKPLIVLEALRCGYEWACDRFHAFILQGMADSAPAFEGTPVRHCPNVDDEAGAGSGLVEAAKALRLRTQFAA